MTDFVFLLILFISAVDALIVRRKITLCMTCGSFAALALSALGVPLFVQVIVYIFLIILLRIAVGFAAKNKNRRRNTDGGS